MGTFYLEGKNRSYPTTGGAGRPYGTRATSGW
ncbi:hypothetical protein HNR30_005431 [Nonomuraea soli]|uniref:Uncharacterized protein n=1 Tax=Nonomuraea soli TaxID=1032476 RepID=A0A7W0HSJ6_9ACTN|nr:hypothetical protein [Nonomuraea soli]